MPPDDDGDDEEGRFFGGGITKQESQILEYVDEVDHGQAQEKIDAAWLRKSLVNFEKRITKNAELRAKFEHEPQKFISSEADLDAEIKNLSILAEHPELYTEFVNLESTNSLVGLLAHENTDIAIDAIELIGELTDEDVAAEEEQFDALADAFIRADLIDLLVSNLTRLNEDDETDRNGVYYALGVIENLCSRNRLAIRIAEEERLLRWLLERIQKKEVAMSQNKQYAAEIIALLAQASPDNRTRLMKIDAVDLILQLVAPYRKRDPERGSEEEEYMENLFEALTCFVDDAEGKRLFVEAEGVELALIAIKESKTAKTPALRLVDHASAGEAGTAVCQRLVDAGGLKNVFTLFMKSQDTRQLEHLVAIFANMLRLLPGESPERIRTLAKFVEKGYEKIKKIVKLRWDYASRIQRAEREFGKEQHQDADDDLLEVELISRRLDAGLYTLQLIDTILAWLAAEDRGAKKFIKTQLSDRDEGLDSIQQTLREQLEALKTEDDTKDLREMIGTLIDVLSI